VSRGGETLVEVVVALLVLAVGALALASGIGQAQRARRLAASSGLALAAAEAWLEMWRAGPARGSASGAGSIFWGVWQLDLEWQTESPSDCVESAHVSVASASGEATEARLSSRRFLSEVDGCGR
jgi:Tfp pilus assembly protein PilV